MLVITNSQKVTLTLRASGEEDKELQLNTVPTPTWVSSDPAVATVTPATNGLSAVVSSVKSGKTTITASGNGNLGNKVVTLLTATLEVEVLEEATKLEIIASEPEAK